MAWILENDSSGGTSSAIIMMILVFAILAHQRRRAFNIVRKIQNKKRKMQGVISDMKDFVRDYIGKDCILYTINGQLMGTIREVSDNALKLEYKDSLEVINLDYIIRLREHPKNKKGKNKSIVID